MPRASKKRTSQGPTSNDPEDLACQGKLPRDTTVAEDVLVAPRSASKRISDFNDLVGDNTGNHGTRSKAAEVKSERTTRNRKAADTTITENKRNAPRSSRKRAGDFNDFDGGDTEAVAIPDALIEEKSIKPVKKPKTATKVSKTTQPIEPVDPPIETEKIFPGGDRVEVEPATSSKRGRKPSKKAEKPEAPPAESSSSAGKSTKTKKSGKTLDVEELLTIPEDKDEEIADAADKTKTRGRPKKSKAISEKNAHAPEPSKLSNPTLDEEPIQQPSKSNRGKGRTAKEPAVKEPATEEPSTTEPPAKEPTTKQTAPSKPATAKPVTVKPITAKPAAAKPAAAKPATKKPSTRNAPKDSATEKPATKEVGNKEPAPKEPSPKVSKLASKGDTAKETADLDDPAKPKPSRGRKSKNDTNDPETSTAGPKSKLSKKVVKSSKTNEAAEGKASDPGEAGGPTKATEPGATEVPGPSGKDGATESGAAEVPGPSRKDGATAEASKSNKRKTPPGADSDAIRDVLDPLSELASTKKKQRKGLPGSLEGAKASVGGLVAPVIDTVTHGAHAAKGLAADVASGAQTSIMEDVTTGAEEAIDADLRGPESPKESEESPAKKVKDKGKGKRKERAKTSRKEAKPIESSNKDVELETSEGNLQTTAEDNDEDYDEEEDLEEDDQTLAILVGFDDSDEEAVQGDGGFKQGQEVPAAPTTSKAKPTKGDTEGPGVVYVGRIPHGFYEHEMRAYFSQFGPITRLRLSRNRNTGASKHYAFIEFASAEVASIVAGTMNSYLLFGHILRCKVVPPEQVHEKLWIGANRRFKKVPWNRIEGRKLDQPMGREGWERRVEAEKKRRGKKNKGLKGIGYEGPSVDLREVDDVPVREEEENERDDREVQALEQADSTEEVIQEEKTVLVGSGDGVLVVREEITTSKVSRSKRKAGHEKAPTLAPAAKKVRGGEKEKPEAEGAAAATTA